MGRQILNRRIWDLMLIKLEISIVMFLKNPKKMRKKVIFIVSLGIEIEQKIMAN